ncbi:MAG: hypothetical protein BGN87_02475 [Rhizobiales bacterium 65-79]|nr:MAG: hypothetical protein BGN87_02475 [Rhizobiales bacterium 65-79]
MNGIRQLEFSIGSLQHGCLPENITIYRSDFNHLIGYCRVVIDVLKSIVTLAIRENEKFRQT